MGKMIDITGQRFGKLLVISCAGKIDGRHYFWNCKCDCGNDTVIEGSRLRSGNTKSCGCGKYDGFKKYNANQSEKAKIPIGTRFGKLVVIEDLGFRKQVEGHSRRWYRCQCDCGNIKDVMGNILKQNQTISCGSCLSSKGEYKIEQLLQQHGIIYAHDYTIPQLKQDLKRNLRFDFVIYDNQNQIVRCIEFDGRQHYDGPDTTYWGHSTDSLQTIQQKDSLKNNWCKENNIPLVRIPYWIEPTIEILLGEDYLVKEE